MSTIWYISLSWVATVATAILQYYTKRLKNKELANKLAGAGVIIVIIASLSTFILAIRQDEDNNDLRDSVSSLKKSNDVIGSTLGDVQKQLYETSQELENIENAIKKANLKYDPSKNRIIKTVNSQFNLEGATFNAPVQQGNGNIQRN